MSRGPLAFKETDVARALRAAAKAGGGYHVRVERATGDILILPGQGPAPNVRPASTVADDDDRDVDLDAELEAWDSKRRA